MFSCDDDDKRIIYDDETHLRNCGSRECHELLSCFSVRNSSKVDTVLGSHLMVPIRLHTWSFSKLMKRVHPLKQKMLYHSVPVEHLLN